MSFRRCLVALGLVSLPLIGTSACGSDDPKPDVNSGANDRIDFALGPRTKQLDAKAISALQMGADTSQTLRFDAAVGSTYARGDVLMAGTSDKTPRGLLRVVREVKTENGVTTVETEQAPLQLAFSKLHAHIERSIPIPTEAPPPIRPKVELFKFDEAKPIDMYVFNGDKDPSTLEDQLHLNDVYRGKIGVNLDIDFEWGFVDLLIGGIDDFLDCIFELDCPDLSLPELKATVSAQMVVSSTFDHAGAASKRYVHPEFDIGEKIHLPKIELGPLLITPDLVFKGKVEGNAGSYARLAGSSEMGYALEASLSTNGAVTANATPIKNFRVDAAEAFLDGRVQTAVGPRLELLAWGAIGPTVGVEFTSDLQVDRTRDADCYRAYMGINAVFGFVVRFPWRALGTWITKSEKIGEDLEDVGRFFGLAGDILNVSKSFKLTKDDDPPVAQGQCSTPPPSMLPPGAPQDTIFATPPFPPWSKRFDEPGDHYPFSAFQVHNSRTRFVLGVDGHIWAIAEPSPTVRRISIDGKSLSATRYIAKVEDDKELALPVSDVIERTDLVKWVLFENGTIARLGADDAYFDAFGIDVPHAEGEVVTLRRGAAREDGRVALIFGIRQQQNTYDHRAVLVELDPAGKILRSRVIGQPTNPDVQTAFFTATHPMYRPDGSLLIAGETTAGVAQLDTHCMVFSIKDDGSVGFATELKTGRENGTCTFGAISSEDNGDILLAGATGVVFTNSGNLAVMDANGQVKSSSTYTFEGDSLILPSFVKRLPTSGYIVVGSDAQSATRAGTFIARLDGEGIPLTVTSARTPENVQVAFPDALITKDAGVVFGALADWHDFADNTNLTRFLFGKAFAKDGTLTFNAASGITMTKVPDPGGAKIGYTGAPFTPVFTDLPLKTVPRTLRAEPVSNAETVFAP